jgi:hypothetical protein
MTINFYPPWEWVILSISIITFTIGYQIAFQEKLHYIFYYILLIYLGDFCWLFLILTQLNDYSLEIKGLFVLSTIIIFGIFSPLFWSLLTIKRTGQTYKVNTIYDLGQFNITAPRLSKILSFLIWIVSPIPPSPGFLMRWVWANSIFAAHPYVGILSFWTSVLISIPCLRIFAQIWMNKTLMLHKKGPRWYFDKNIKKIQFFLLYISTVLGIILCIQPSLVWFVNDIS